MKSVLLAIGRGIRAIGRGIKAAWWWACDLVARSAKAIGAGIGALQAQIVTVMSSSGMDSLSQLSQAQWLVIGGASVTAATAVYGVPNAESSKGQHHEKENQDGRTNSS